MERLKHLLQKHQADGALRTLRPLKKLGHGLVRPLSSPPESTPFFDFSSNDYLALSEHPDVIAASRAALEAYGAGSGAARLMSGDLEIHHQLEEAVAGLKGQEAGLIFGSGYQANTGVIPALLGRNDVMFTDRLNHASIYDGCRLAGAKMIRFRHNDCNHLEELLRTRRGEGQALIVVESVYSMDGDFCPLREIVSLKNRFSCMLMVDEAHATGVFGANGGGLVEEEGISRDVDIAMGTFGKALGSYGAYVAASAEMITFLINRARSFIYSTALPPAVIGASIAAVKIIQQKPQLREDLHRKTALFKEALRHGGLTIDLGPSQIIPIPVGDSQKALELSEDLAGHHLFTTAVRPPTVPEGTARLRFSITRHHREKDLEQAAATLLDELRKKSG